MKFLRWIFYLALAAAIIYGAYLVYMKWVNGEPISSLWRTAKEYASSTESAVNSTTKTVNAVQTGIASATDAFAAAKTSIGGVLSGLGSAIEDLGTGISGATSTSPVAAAPSPTVGPAPAPSSGAFLVPPPPATVTTAVGAPLYFSLNSGQSYSISWGDGATDAGSLNASEVTVVKHSWSAAGDYIVKVTIDASSYTFPIRVYNQ